MRVSRRTANGMRRGWGGAESSPMTAHLVEDVDILLWPHPTGLSAFAAPFVLDLEYDAEGGGGTIDASSTHLRDHPYGFDRYRVLDGPGRACVLKAALARRDNYRLFSPDSFGGYLVRHHEPGIDEAAFLRIVAAFIHAWRLESGIA